PELTRRRFYGAWNWYPGYATSFGFPGVTSVVAFPAVNNDVVESTISFVLPVATASIAASVAPFLTKRQYRYGGYGGYGGWSWGFPFMCLFDIGFDCVSDHANFSENTLYTSNINANQANDAIHSNTNNFASD
ncbi:hypothetical protein EC988_007693, partial [Linderina pennispora]